MKLGLPDRKWMSNPVSSSERDLAAKLFGDSDILEEINSNKSFAPLPILCHLQRLGFIGEDIGLTEPVCGSFFLAPTDQGICMTVNQDIKAIVNNYERYEVLMDSSLQKSTSKIEGGSIWSQMTFALTDHIFLQSVF